MKLNEMGVTASKFALLNECNYWCLNKPEKKPVSSQSALAGTEMHEAMEASLNFFSFESENENASILLEWLKSRFPDLFELSYYCEQTFAYDSRGVGVYFGGRDVYAEYGLPGTLFGTADLIIVTEEKVYVIDWKSSANGCNKAYAQMQFLAYCADIYYNKNVVCYAVAPEGESHYVKEYKFNRYDLVEAVLEEAKNLLEFKPRLKIVAGPHCSDYYCPSQSICPAYVNALDKIKREGMQPMLEYGEIAPYFCDEIKTGEDYVKTELAIKAAENFINSYKARTGEFERRLKTGDSLGFGYKLMITDVKSKRFKKDEALELLSRHVSQDELNSLYGVSESRRYRMQREKPEKAVKTKRQKKEKVEND